MNTLKEGDPVPDITLKDHQDNDFRLSDLKGKKVVLYFYPKDNTPGCTKEACNFRDNYQELREQGYEVIGVSPDSAASHTKFKDKFDLPFPLLADTEKELANAFGVFGEKKFMGKTYMGIHRTTFVIDEKGIIERVISKVKTKEAAEQVMQA